MRKIAHMVMVVVVVVNGHAHHIGLTADLIVLVEQAEKVIHWAGY